MGKQAGVLVLILKSGNAVALEQRASFRLHDSLTDRPIKTMSLALEAKSLMQLRAEPAGRIEHNLVHSLPPPILSTCLHRSILVLFAI
jgi:hypothetical protein